MLVEQVLGLPRNVKRLLMLGCDAVILPLALWLAFALRYGQFSPPIAEWLWLFPVAPLVAMPVFVRMGLYRAVVRYMGDQAIWTIGRAVSLAVLLWGLVLLLSGLQGVPRSVILIYWLTAFSLVAGSRLLARVWLSRYGGQLRGRRQVLIYGAGAGGVQLASGLRYDDELCPVAFLDDDRSLVGHHVSGLQVHAPEELESLITRYQIEEVLLAMPSISRQRRRNIIDQIEPYPVRVRTLPGLSELAKGHVRVEDLREIDVCDLLGRDPVPPDQRLLETCIRGKSVMVTGAGGSIGSELCRQIVRIGPERLILFERSEATLYQVEHELRALLKKLKVTDDMDSSGAGGQRQRAPISIIPVLGSAQNRSRVERVCQAFHVQTIYHAAAYKHVPMVERNPIEAIENNIFGTLYTAQAALRSGVETFVLVSTDKAVRPTNVMGATKRFAELILQGLSERYPRVKLAGQPRPTRFCMVRFGNVLNSSGSVVPLFRRQIHEGGPITVTHPHIIRYFMTIPEAAQLVIQAGAMGRGGDVFVLDMGEPVRILDLAHHMVRLSGLEVKDEHNPDGDIEIKFTGLRPGEKLYEELLIGNNVLPAGHPKIRRAHEQQLAWERIEFLLAGLRRAAMELDHEAIRRLLIEAVPEYRPDGEIKDTIWSAEVECRKRTSAKPEGALAALELAGESG